MRPRGTKDPHPSDFEEAGIFSCMSAFKGVRLIVVQVRPSPCTRTSQQPRINGFPQPPVVPAHAGIGFGQISSAVITFDGAECDSQVLGYLSAAEVVEHTASWW